ncbi:hypothetical protein [Sphingomonas oligophenolica]|uniref:hypothetical protein n=1 Tax=Sphingomonas oligophenolica TaxID=301154 RepID=UPI0031F5BE85
MAFDCGPRPSGTAGTGLPELSLDLMAIFNAQQRSSFQRPNAPFFAGLRGRF